MILPETVGVQVKLAFLIHVGSLVVGFFCHVTPLAVFPVWHPSLIENASNPVVYSIKPFIIIRSCHTLFNRRRTMNLEHLKYELPEEVQVRLLDTTDRLT